MYNRDRESRRVGWENKVFRNNNTNTTAHHYQPPSRVFYKGRTKLKTSHKNFNYSIKRDESQANLSLSQTKFDKAIVVEVKPKWIVLFESLPWRLENRILQNMGQMTKYWILRKIFRDANSSTCIDFNFGSWIKIQYSRSFLNITMQLWDCWTCK